MSRIFLENFQTIFEKVSNAEKIFVEVTISSGPAASTHPYEPSRQKFPEIVQGIFEKVVSIKTEGWINLVNTAEISGTKDLRIACCFTSIAGRFGNAGQTDYSAANCILDAEMSRLNATNKTRAIAIAWTGWREVGMATKGSIETVFEQAGIQTVGLEKGVKLFVDEILSNGKRRVVIAGNLGILDELGVQRDPPLLMPSKI